jgi:ArsR family transcriptional regulator, virulence genes transcriptional regulator
MEEIYKLHSEICKTLANPLRLKIINVLEDKERAAGYLLETIEISKANLSKHMGILIQKGVVQARKQGKNVFYRLTDERITRACTLMREVMIKNLEKSRTILSNIK